MNTILYDYVCEELEDVERDGLKAGNLDSTDKLVNIKKNLLKIEKYENEMDGGYSMGDGYWEAQGSYAGEPMNDGYSSARRGEHWVRGHYSRDDRMIGGGNSYRDGRRMYNRDGGYSYRRRDRRGRYSRSDGKEDMMESMKEIMDEATTEKEREIIRDAMSKLEKA